MAIDFAQAVNLLSAAATSVAAILIYIQIRSDRAWDRLETSHNILNELVSGKLEDTLELLEQKLGWDILHDSRTYDEVTRDIDPANIDELDRLLRRLFRRFEAICISMDHRSGSGAKQVDGYSRADAPSSNSGRSATQRVKSVAR